MEAFTVHTGTAAPLRRSNVDTDQIIPAEYLKRITRHGFEDGLFSAWRSHAACPASQDFSTDASSARVAASRSLSSRSGRRTSGGGTSMAGLRL